jgi:hypothetical protein
MQFPITFVPILDIASTSIVAMELDLALNLAKTGKVQRLRAVPVVSTIITITLIVVYCFAQYRLATRPPTSIDLINVAGGLHIAFRLIASSYFCWGYYQIYLIRKK